MVDGSGCGGDIQIWDGGLGRAGVHRVAPGYRVIVVVEPLVHS